MSRFIAVLAFAATALIGASLPASAHGSHVSVGIYAGGPVYPAYYPYHYYRPYYRPYWGPSVVYAPPPVVYAPAPVYYNAPPAMSPTPTQQCQSYNGNATVDGSGQPFYGNACLFTDGRWHIMN